MCPPPNGTQLPASSAKPQPNIIDPLAALWADAITRYENDTRTKLSSPSKAVVERESTKGSSFTHNATLDSADAVFDYVREHEASFKAFREGGAGPLLHRLRPIAKVVTTLSGIIGEAVGIPFAPGMAVFAAIGELVKASLAVQDDYDAVYTAFETMEAHLRIIQPVVEGDLHPTLREASVKLLAQILTVLGVITKLQKDGRIRTWLKKLAQSKEVSSALDDLGQLATSHHQAVSAVTLATSQKTLSMLTESIQWAAEDQDVNRRCLKSVAQIAQQVYDELRRSTSATCEAVISNRGILESLQTTLLHHIAAVADDKTSAGMDKICRWLEYQDSSPRLNELLHNRAPSTGAWFLDGEDFAALKTGKKRVLWLQGKAGSGKSTMIAGAINDLWVASAWADSEALVLYHFFDATNTSRSRELRTLLSSLLCQLGHLRTESLSSLLRFHKDNMHGHSQPALDALYRQLDRLLDDLSAPVFVVVDALDEADDANEEIIEFLEHLRIRPDIRLLLSSRGEVLFRERLMGLCDSHVIVSEDLVKGDIGIVLHGALTRGGVLGKVKDTDLVREALQVGADGSFRWTAIQIQELSRIAGIPTKVRQKLKTLPKSLSETYERSLQAIDPDDRADVHRLLIWLVLACVPLTTTDFALLLAFDYSDRIPSFDAGLQPSSADAVLSLVGSTFLSVHDGEVRLAHASVKDYLLALPPTSDFHVNVQLSHSLMARTGLAYLSAMPDAAKEARAQMPNQLTYSWVVHVAKAGTDVYADLERDAVALLRGLRGSGYLSDALQAAAQIGHALLVHLLIKELDADVDARDEPNFTALHYAARENHLSIARLLLDKMDVAKLNGAVSRISPLHCAAAYGHKDMIALLISRGLDIDTRSNNGFIALHNAAISGQASAVRCLVGLGSTIGARDVDHGSSPLHYAVQRGCDDAVAALLDLGADVEQRDKYWLTPLHTAAISGRLEAARKLIARGADMATQFEQYSPVHTAAMNSFQAIVALLLDSGVPLDDRSAYGCTALHIAAENGHAELVQMLLSRGSDHTVRERRGATPLHLASVQDRDEVIMLLLDTGADSNVGDNSGTTPLHDACRNNSCRAARVLLDGGGEIDARDTSQLTPMLHAVFMGHQEAVELLLMRGADTAGHGGPSVLHSAAWAGHVGITRLIISHGVSVHTHDEVASTPLHSAALKGQEDIITLLLDMGADLESRYVDGCTALHYATRGAYLGTVSILLERGADANAREKTGKTALHLAATGIILRSAAEERSAVEGPAPDRSDLSAPSMRPIIEVARVFINSGAHADSQDDNGNQPLHLAAFHEEEGIVRLLIAAGVSPTSPNRIGRIPEDGIGTNSQLSASPARRERVRQLLDAGMTVMGDQK